MFSEVALYKLRVEIYDWKPYSSFLYFNVNVLNKAPVFTNLTELPPLKIRFNTTFEYLLPPREDPEGNPIYIYLDSNPDIINNFAWVYPWTNPYEINFSPNSWSQVTKY